MVEKLDDIVSWEHRTNMRNTDAEERTQNIFTN